MLLQVRPTTFELSQYSFLQMNKKQKKLENESEKIMKQERQKEDTLSLG